MRPATEELKLCSYERAESLKPFATGIDLQPHSTSKAAVLWQVRFSRKVQLSSDPIILMVVALHQVLITITVQGIRARRPVKRAISLPVYIDCAVSSSLPIAHVTAHFIEMSLVQIALLLLILWAAWTLLRGYIIKTPLDNLPGPPAQSLVMGKCSKISV